MKPQNKIQVWETERLVCSQTYLRTDRELLISFEVQTSLKKKVTLVPSLHIFPVGKKQTKSHNWTLIKRLSQKAGYIWEQKWVVFIYCQEPQINATSVKCGGCEFPLRTEGDCLPLSTSGLM